MIFKEVSIIGDLDGDSFASDELGMIRVEICRVKPGEAEGSPEGGPVYLAPIEQTVNNEEKKAILLHQVG